jgi:HK97 family phage portal protein
MRVATPSGIVDVRARSWPLAGLNYPSRWENRSHTVRLADLPGGTIQTSTYANIYRTNPWIFTAVNAYARGISRLVPKVYEYDPDGNRTRVRSDLPGSLGRRSVGQTLDFLLRMPEPNVGRQEWLRKIVLDRMVYGNAIVVKDRNPATNVPQALYHVPWSRVTVVEGDDVPVLYYEISGRGMLSNGYGSNDPRRLAPEDVIHFGRGTDLDSPIGLSPIAPLKYTLALHDALWRHAVAYFQNSARPSGMIRLDKGATEQTITRVRDQIERLYTAPEQAGKILVTSGEWQSMMDAPDQSQIVDLARLSREEISAAYGIPQPMMGILDRAILNNVKELRNYFTRDSIGVEASAIEDDLMAQLVLGSPTWTGLFLEFDLDVMLRPDLEARADVYEKMRHVLTPNEMREMEQRAPIDAPEADTVWMPAGQQGLGFEPVDTSPAPADPGLVPTDPNMDVPPVG